MLGCVFLQRPANGPRRRTAGMAGTAGFRPAYRYGLTKNSLAPARGVTGLHCRMPRGDGHTRQSGRASGKRGPVNRMRGWTGCGSGKFWGSGRERQQNNLQPKTRSGRRPFAQRDRPGRRARRARWYALPVHLCRFRVRSKRWGYFLEVPGRTHNPISVYGFRPSSTLSRLRNINLIPIGYAFRPRLRGRLTLRRLALRRNPWTFGESVSHTLCRYSCQHSHFWYLQDPSRVSLHRRTERSATTPEGVRSFGAWL